METNNTQGRFGKWVKSSITVRMLMVGFLILILIIPLKYIEGLIGERRSRQYQVINEINQQWGREVLLYGPILKVPYKTYEEKQVYSEQTRTHRTEVKEFTRNAYFFPEQLNIDTKVNTEEKHRGIYTTAIYKSEIDISGSFSKPDFSEKEVSPKDILWDKAKLIIQTSNLKGVNNQVTMDMNGHKYPFSARFQRQEDRYDSDLHFLESKSIEIKDLPKDGNVAFSMTMSVNGSREIRFIPIGKETSATMLSNWESPNSIGEYLPYEKAEVEKGFDYKWKILDINRPFPQQAFVRLPNLREYAFGVDFYVPVDEYAESDRSAKYGLLVITLTFLVFFLIQTISKIPIHPFQYLMIGIALTMFYTLLVSISEHSNFLKAYIIAGASVIALITLYSKSILKGRQFPLLIGVSLTALYTFIFVIIQLESYALLVGSIGLFLILAAVMYASRKIDWSNG